MADENEEQRTMVECETCHVWYHELCIKDQMYSRTLNYYDYVKIYDEKNRSDEKLAIIFDENVKAMPLDIDANFNCILCLDLMNMLSGFPG